MADPLRPLVGWKTLAILYVLASPIFALRGLARLIAAQRAAALIRSGFLRCPHCRHGNRLDVLARCPRCGFREHRSLALPCAHCGYVPGWIDCAGCGASLRLP